MQWEDGPPITNTNFAFLSHFNLKFPLHSTVSWLLFCFPSRIVSKIFVKLQRQPLPMASWQQFNMTRSATWRLDAISAAAIV